MLAILRTSACGAYLMQSFGHPHLSFRPMNSPARFAIAARPDPHARNEELQPSPSNTVTIPVSQLSESVSTLSALQQRPPSARQFPRYLPLAGISLGMAGVLTGTALGAVSKDYEPYCIGLIGFGIVTLLGSTIANQTQIFNDAIQARIEREISLAVQRRREQPNLAERMERLGLTEACLRDAVDLVTLTDDELDANGIPLNGAEALEIANQLRQLALANDESLSSELRRHVLNAQNNPVNLVRGLVHALRASRDRAQREGIPI